MHYYTDPQSSLPVSFQLNMQILCDSLSERFELIARHLKWDPLCLTGPLLYQEGFSLNQQFLYIVVASLMDENFQFQEEQHYLIIGKADLPAIPQKCCVLQFGPISEYVQIINQIHRTFEKYHHWDIRLHAAVSSTTPIDDMLEASLPIFHNPIFAHDTNFYIISSSHHVSGMSIWVRDPKTGRDMVPLSLINDFKVDLEYLSTLGTHGANLFSKELRGYRILYTNLWSNHRYMGRICVNELETPLLQSHYPAMEYLALFVEYCLQQHTLFSQSLGQNIDDFFADYLNGTIKEEANLYAAMEAMNWKRHDRYLCMRLKNERTYTDTVTSAATLGHIETQIPDGIAFVYQNGISVIVNLTTMNSSAANVISSLAIIIREGLFKMGVSYELDDFLSIPQGNEQASIALRLGQSSGSMIWCYRFEDYFLEHILSSSTTSISPEMLYSRQLQILKKYDAENNTDLFHTLEIYLNLERNVLQTAKTLFIHRSTLFYRLDRIQKLTKLDLDNPKTRLTLLISFALLKK